MAISKKFALGAIVGMTAGVIAGMLTAPKAGKDTRANIRQRAADMKSNATETVDHAMGKAEEYMHRAEDAVRDAKRDIAKGHKTSEGEHKDVTKKGFWDK